MKAQSLLGPFSVAKLACLGVADDSIVLSPTHTAQILRSSELQHSISEENTIFYRKKEQSEVSYCADQYQALWLVQTGDPDSCHKTRLFRLPGIPSCLLP